MEWEIKEEREVEGGSGGGRGSNILKLYNTFEIIHTINAPFRIQKFMGL